MGKIYYTKDINWNIVETEIRDEKDERIAELEEENKKLKEKLDNRDLLLEWKRKEVQTLFKVNEELTAENKKLKEEKEFFYKSAKQFREQVEKWEKDYREWNIVDARNG